MVETWTESKGDAGDASAPAASQMGTWWERYTSLGLKSFSGDARKAVEEDSRDIAQRCVLSPDVDDGWDASRVRRGIVVGAIQSGKTASMLGLSALLLDSHADVLVILAGRQISLWKQTLERFMSDLDGTNLQNDSLFERATDRVLIPDPESVPDEDRLDPRKYLNLERGKFRKALRGLEKKIVVVIPKDVTHLRALRQFFEEEIGTVKDQVRRYHMVVLDDEADDGSILDADDNKTIPRSVQQLWTGSGTHGTFQENLYATYVAYTATPQANYLQRDQNPLAPKDFCAALRVPADGGKVTSYCEPEGIARYYHGGELFYELGRGSSGGLTDSLPFPNRDDFSVEDQWRALVRTSRDDLLMRGLRAYLVSGAIRHQWATGRGKMSLSKAFKGFDPGEEKRLPGPHCMLIHPSALMSEHLEEARRLVLWSRGEDPDAPTAPRSVSEEDRKLDIGNLETEMDTDSDQWTCWIDSFRDSRNQLGIDGTPGIENLLEVPPSSGWPVLKEIILKELLPQIKIRIINSDEESDDRPDFKVGPKRADGLCDPPPDLLTIFVSGNVMSRGITIQGLCSSVFTRPAGENVADTQMQMQRWFGYRGEVIHLCRLFCFEDQLQHFRDYHDHDLLIRKEILERKGEDQMGSPQVLVGMHSMATAKVPHTKLPLHPGATPSIRLLEIADFDLAKVNADVLADLLELGDWQDLEVNGTLRGVIRNDRLSLLEIADILDQFRYSNHRPNPSEHEHYNRWSSQEAQHGIAAGQPEYPLYRGPAEEMGYTDPAVNVQGCPYSIAAYLRFWYAACGGGFDGQGLSRSDARDKPWWGGLHTPPTVNLAVRFGDAGVSSWSRLSGNRTPIQAMKRSQESGPQHQIQTLWGSSPSPGAAYFGDQLMDYHFRGKDRPGFIFDSPMWRPRGDDGLLVFHVIRPEDGCGDDDGVTVGLSLPHGGPDQFCAVR
jgi:hypothetical protein